MQLYIGVDNQQMWFDNLQSDRWNIDKSIENFTQN